MQPILKRCEWRSRVVHETVDGGEIWNGYYIEPYSAYPLVMSTLLGGIKRKADGTVDNDRIMPTRDPYQQHYYCVDCRVDPIHDDAFSGSPGTGYKPTPQEPPEASLGRLKLGLTKVPRPDGPNFFSYAGFQNDGDPFVPVPMGGAAENNDFTAGAFVTGIFRPVRTAYPINYLSEGTPDPDDEKASFDAVDPRFEPYTLAVCVDKSLKILQSNLLFQYSSVGQAASLPENYQHFTIRRRMCPKVPWQTIAKLANKCNLTTSWFPQVNGKNLLLLQLPDGVFPKGTLKFTHAEVTEQMVSNTYVTDLASVRMRNALTQTAGHGDFSTDDKIPDARIQVWYDILYHFEWRTQYDYMLNRIGGEIELDWVPWNYSLCEPGWTPNFFGGVFNPAVFNYLAYYPVGWNKKPALQTIWDLAGSYRDPYADAWNASVIANGKGFDNLFDITAD